MQGIGLGISRALGANDAKPVIVDIDEAALKMAAKELGAKYGAEITIDWQTPADEDAQKQAQSNEIKQA